MQKTRSKSRQILISNKDKCRAKNYAKLLIFYKKLKKI